MPAADGLARAIAGGCIPLPPPGDDGFAAIADRWADCRVLMLERGRIPEPARQPHVGIHRGTVTAASDWDAGAEVKTILPSHPDSFERLCHDNGTLRFLLDFRRDGDLAARLSQTLLQRFIGVIYRPERERLSHYMQARAGRQYDGWIWFDRTQALVGAGDGGKHDDVPDTRPFGL